MILCYGDSNTFGYDPRDFFGTPYEFPWPALLEKHLGEPVVNFGENGRTLPRHPAEFRVLESKIRALTPDLLLVMLGTNDLLEGLELPDSLHSLLQLLGTGFPDLKVVLLAPPPMRHMEIPVEMFRRAAEEAGVLFCDPGLWDLPLAHDRVHLTEEGHRIFAAQLADFLGKRPM